VGWEGDLLVTSPAMTVTESLAVCSAIARAFKDAGSQTQEPTRIRQAEHLMQCGFIDTQAVIDMTPVQDFTHEEANE